MTTKKEYREWIKAVSRAMKRPCFDQTPESLAALTKLVRDRKPDVVLELGTGRGLSLAAWCAAAPKETRITTVDHWKDGLANAESYGMTVDWERFEFVHTEVQAADLGALMGRNGERVLLYVDVHGIRAMRYIIRTALQDALLAHPGSLVVLDDAWFADYNLAQDRAALVQFRNEAVMPFVAADADFRISYFGRYWKGGGFLGFQEIRELMAWVNVRKIVVEPLGDKALMFDWPPPEPAVATEPAVAKAPSPMEGTGDGGE